MMSLENVDHSEELFLEYLLGYETEICPVHGVITYWDGEVLCSIHSCAEVDEQDEEDNSIPYL